MESPLQFLIQTFSAVMDTLPPRTVEAMRAATGEETDAVLDELGAFPEGTKPEYYFERKDTPK